MRSTWTIFLLLATLGAPAFADAPQPNRILKLIDFEERQLGNNEDLPMHWMKMSGVGLPHYLNGLLATDRAHSGQYSFRFDLNGGSLLYQYDPHQLPIQSGARYRITCFCQTTSLPNARARLIAYFTDIDGHPLPGLSRQSELYASQPEDRGWKKLTIELTADDPNAAYLCVELGLLQPALYSNRTLGEREILPQDIHGSAWFDDLSVAQIPQVTLSTNRPGNIFRLGDPPRVSVEVNDLFTDDLQSRLTITDATGAQIYQRSGATDLTGAQIVGPTRKRLTVLLPAIAAGWYHVNLQMTSHGKDLGDQSIDFVQLADPAQPMPPDPRFGVVASDLRQQELAELPDILPLLSAGRVKIALWSRDGEIQSSDATDLDTILEKLHTDGISPIGCLLSPPPSLSAQIGGTSWSKLLQAPPSVWQPQIDYLISRHAGHMDGWQLGDDFSDDFVADSRMRQAYHLIYDQFSVLIHNPDVGMPWPVGNDFPRIHPSTLVLSVPPQVLPFQIPLYLRDASNVPVRASPAVLQGDSTGEGSPGVPVATSSSQQFSVSLSLTDEKYGRALRLRDIAERMVYAATAGATPIDVPLPFTLQTFNERTLFQPREELIIERTVIRMLSGSTYKGTFPLDGGAEAYLFDRNGTGILALWNRGAAPKPVPLILNLGPDPLKVDLWGNASALAKAAGQTRVEAGPMPVFIVGVDSLSAQIRASVAIDQPLLESTYQTYIRHLTFTNPAGRVLNGSLHIRPPTGWAISPASFQFSLNPGQKLDRQLTIDFPYNSLAGTKFAKAEFSLEGEGGSDFTVPLTLELGLSDVGLQCLAVRDGKDIVVQELITNYSERPIDYSASATYPGMPRQERLVTALDPGKSAIKFIRFKNAKFLPGLPVRCGLHQLEGTRVLNEEVTIQ